MGIHQSIILISVLSFGFSDSLPQENNGSCPQSCIDAMDQQSMGPTLGKAAPHNLGGAVNYNRIEAMIERKFSEQKRWIRKKVKRLQVSSNEEMKTIEEHITSDINDFEESLQENLTRWFSARLEIEAIKADMINRDNGNEKCFCTFAIKNATLGGSLRSDLHTLIVIGGLGKHPSEKELAYNTVKRVMDAKAEPAW